MAVNWTTVASRGAAVLVALVAGAASFEHIASVAVGAGERAVVGWSLPLAVDGLILVGVAALVEDQRAGRAGRLSARLAVLVGVVATLAANVASAQPTATARLVAVAAPVSFLLAVEVLTRAGRPLRQPEPAGVPVASAPVASPQGAIPGPGQGATPDATPAPRRGANPGATRGAGGGATAAAAKVAAARRRSPDATQAEVAKRLKLGRRTVARHWHLGEGANGSANRDATGDANSAPGDATWDATAGANPAGRDTTADANQGASGDANGDATGGARPGAGPAAGGPLPDPGRRPDPADRDGWRPAPAGVHSAAAVPGQPAPEGLNRVVAG